MTTLRITLALLASAAVLGVTPIATATTHAAAPATTVATVASLDYRAVIKAQRTSGGSAPTAAVSAVVYRSSGHGWRMAGVHRLAGTFFWKTVTASHAICRIDLQTSGTPKLSVQLLVSPSVGCARTQVVALGG